MAEFSYSLRPKEECPCKYCKDDRYVGCHSECDKYKNWNSDTQKDRDDYNKEVFTNKSLDSYKIDNMISVEKQKYHNGSKHYEN